MAAADLIDPIDDAIGAVVRAVERIERATRDPHAVDDAPSDHGAASTPPASAAPTTPLGAGTLPDPASLAALTTALSSAGAPAKKAKKGKKARAADAEQREQAAAVAAVALQQALAQQRLLGAAGVTPASAAAGGPPPQVHELVGKLVARNQQLDEHLTSAQALRAEIGELIAKLAATTDPG